VLHFCHQIVRLLIASREIVSPVSHHYITLVTLVLLELVDVGGARGTAEGYLADLANHAIMPSSWNAHILSIIRDKLELTLPDEDTAAAEQTTRESLRRLTRPATSSGTKPPEGAALAEEDVSVQYRNLGFNPMVILSRGYLEMVRESV
jgi:hypothetical protein